MTETRIIVLDDDPTDIAHDKANVVFAFSPNA